MASTRGNVRCRKRARASWVQKVGLWGFCAVIVSIPLWKVSAESSPSSVSNVCGMLMDIPNPPSPTPEQEFVISYTNDVLTSIRQELGCG